MTLFRLSLTAAFCACNLALSVEKAYADSDASSTDAAEDMTHDSGGAYDDDAFDLARLRIDHEYKSEGDEAFYYSYADERISPWHDIPFEADESHSPVVWVNTGVGHMAAAVPTYVEVGVDGEVVFDGLPPHRDDEELFHFVCEIPKGTTAKYEIHKSVAHNPIIQDVKKGKPRFYPKTVPGVEGAEGSLVNYGALTQTWEAPSHISTDTGFGGDNDPIDVLEVLATPCVVGQVMRVRILGCLALVDDNETDWKLIVVNADHEDAYKYYELEDIPKHDVIAADTVDRVREWFRNYKLGDEKPPNQFGLNEKAMGASFAKKIAHETHEAWKTLFAEAESAKCEFNGEACWTGDSSE